MDWGAVLSAAITGVFGLWIALGQRKVKKQVTSSNGVTTAQTIEDLRTDQLKIALAQMEADRKIAEVAEKLAAEQAKVDVDRVLADTDRNVVRAHIIEDRAFQTTVTAIFEPLATLLAKLAGNGTNTP